MVKNEAFDSDNIYLTLGEAYESIDQMFKRRQKIGGKEKGN